MQESRKVAELAIVMLLAGLSSSCASANKVSESPDRFSMKQLPDDPLTHGTSTHDACLRWKLPLRAHLSHISASRNGSCLLVSTSADHGREGRLRVINAAGKTLWIKDLSQPVKAQSLASDGNLAAINTYDGKLAAYDLKNGKRLWERDHLGKPVVLPHSKRVVLLNDDDSEPRTAFTTYDYGGKLLATVSTESEPLDMAVSEDERIVAVVTANKNLLVYDILGKPLSKAKLTGDAVAIKIGRGTAPLIYVLSSREQNRLFQALSAYKLDANASKLELAWSMPLDRKYEAVREAAGTIFLYGNTHFGQALAAFNGSSGTELWHRSYSAPANYSSLVFDENEPNSLVSLAIDEGMPAGVLHLLGVNPDGNVSWDATVVASSGLYSYAYAPQAQAVIAGAGEPGDGLIEYRQISSKPCRR